KTGGGETIQILNRDHGWTGSPSSRAPIDPAFLARIRLEWRPKLLLPQPLVPEPLTVSGLENVNGHNAYVVSLQSSRGLERWYFDTQSALLLKLRRETPTPFGLSTRESEFLDYRPVASAGGGAATALRPFTIVDH